MHCYVVRIKEGLDDAKGGGPLISEGDLGLAVDVEMLIPRMLPRYDRMPWVREVGLDVV